MNTLYDWSKLVLEDFQKRNALNVTNQQSNDVFPLLKLMYERFNESTAKNEILKSDVAMLKSKLETNEKKPTEILSLLYENKNIAKITIC